MHLHHVLRNALQDSYYYYPIRNICYTGKSLLAVESEHAEDFSQNLAIINNDRFHRIVFGLQTDMSVFFVKSFDGSGIVNKRDHRIAVIGGLAAFYKDLVAVKDTGIDHGIALDFQGKRLAARHHVRRNRKITLNILFGQDRLAGRHLADDRNGNHLGADHLKIVVTDLNGARFGGVAPDVSVLFKRFQMRMNGRSRFQIDCLTDLTDRRRITPLQDLFFDIIQYLLLFCGNLTISHKLFPVLSVVSNITDKNQQLSS